ncbi:MAG TPA: ComEC/Rec2 family competence protein [Gemmataceae bacterium]|nr:ComEC/Rec2 family competence protein [Gemmataceae bacterium]
MFTRAVGYAPLFPFAVTATAGIVADRHLLDLTTPVWLLIAAAGVPIWLLASRRNAVMPLAGLWVVAGGLAGAYHHAWRNDFAADDVGNVAGVEPRLVRLRGTLAEEPAVRRHAKDEPLVSRPRADATVTILSVTEIETDHAWSPVSGRVRVTAEGPLTGLHVPDEVEVTGWLARPPGRMNPGEPDFADRLRDDRIRADLRVHSQSGVVRLTEGGWGVERALATARGWGQRGIESSLGPDHGSIASALLLGDNAAMTADEWDRYVRTGVIHVLAISGQHLVILGAFLWFTLRLLGVPRRPAAMIVAVTLLSYALLTGGRPSAMRAAVIACAACGGILLRTRALPANTFALAWLVVLAINPTDLFNAGFQLSFLCVAVLIWGIPRWFPPRERTPLEELQSEARSGPERLVRGVVRVIAQAYLVTLVLGIATAPLVLYWQNVVSPAGVVIGPAAILLTTIALIAGFILMLLWPLGPIAAPVAWVAGRSIGLCDDLVQLAERLPGGCWYAGGVPTWWVIGFYLLGSVWLVASAPAHARALPDFRRPFLFPTALAAWALVGLVAGTARPSSDELRVTFLAVDHGACVVIETPDGRVMLYDAGANSGPDVTKRRIAPYLWSRGIRRIDEVFLSHADLDHFNGLPALLDRFPVGQITCTPTFADKPTGGVRKALAAIEGRGTAVRIARAGDRFTAGEVEISVLHPPADGPVGVENVRSLVLLIRHRGHSLVLTGDLEGLGADMVIRTPIAPVDVLMAPHHGSGDRAEVLAAWARPRLVVSSQGRTDAGKAGAAYRGRGIPYWPTWPEGAITIRSHATGLTAETFATGQRVVVRAGAE